MQAAVSALLKGGIESVKLYGAAGDFSLSAGTGSDDTAALQSALNALPEGGTLVFPPGYYKITSGLTTPTTARFWTIFGYGAYLVTTADIVPLTIGNDGANGGTGLSIMGLGAMTRVSTTGPAFYFKGINRSAFTDLRVNYGGVGAAFFAHGIKADGLQSVTFERPWADAFAVNQTTGIGMWLRRVASPALDATLWNAVTISDAMMEAGGAANLQIEGMQNVEVRGGTIESSNVTRNIYIKSDAAANAPQRVTIRDVFTELSTATNYAIDIENGIGCVIDTVDKNARFRLTGTTAMQVRNIKNLDLEVDGTSTDTAVYGGSINGGGSAIGLTLEVGTRTSLFGVTQGNDGNPLVLREAGVRTFAFVPGSGFQAGPIGAGNFSLMDGGASGFRMLASALTVTAPTGGTNVAGITSTGAGLGSSPGLVGTGGATSGDGVQGTGTGNGNGIVGTGQGIGVGGKFTAGGSAAQIHLVPVTATPSNLADGDIWIENVSGTWHLKVRMNGATSTIV